MRWSRAPWTLLFIGRNSCRTFDGRRRTGLNILKGLASWNSHVDVCFAHDVTCRRDFLASPLPPTTLLLHEPRRTDYYYFYLLDLQRTRSLMTMDRNNGGKRTPRSSRLSVVYESPRSQRGSRVTPVSTSGWIL